MKEWAAAAAGIAAGLLIAASQQHAGRLDVLEDQVAEATEASKRIHDDHGAQLYTLHERLRELERTQFSHHHNIRADLTGDGRLITVEGDLRGDGTLRTSPAIRDL